MFVSELNYDYFEWMYQLVCNEKYYKELSHRKLLRFLHNIEFTYILENDDNRAADGVNLRYRFGHDNGYDYSLIELYLDTKPCSVLEMIVALAMRCEEQIMDDPEIGNRMGQWFWNMLVNLGIGTMNDSKFNARQVHDIIDIFLNREYRANGQGGLFIIDNPPKDLRKVEIWYQMHWYLNDILKGGM